MNLSKVHWPVFRLSEEPPIREGSKLLYSSHRFDLDTAEEYILTRIVDDKSIDLPTLGKRRLAMSNSGVRVFPIRRSIYFLSDLIKLSKANTWFIDSMGEIFQYKKSTRCPLLCKRIKNIHPMKNMGSSLELEGIPTRFKVMFSPKPEEIYAGVIKHGRGYIIYGLYTQPFADSWRMV